MAREIPLLLKQWVAVLDLRTTVVCLHVAGDIVPVHELFETLTGDWPAPPAHIHCRAVCAPWLSGMVNDQRREANELIKALPPKMRRRGPGGYVGPLPPPATPRVRPSVALAAHLRHEDGKDTRLDPEAVRRRQKLGDGAELVRFTDDSAAVLRSGEEDDADREELAGEVARVVGAGIAEAERLSRTETLLERTDDPTLWEVDPGTPLGDAAADVNEEEAVRLAVLDILTGNLVRHGGNIVVTEDDHLVAVDLTGAWPEEPPTWEELTDDDGRPQTLAGWLWENRDALLLALPWVAWRVLLVALRPRFTALGRGEWWSEMMLRLDRLEEAGRAADRDDER